MRNTFKSICNILTLKYKRLVVLLILISSQTFASKTPVFLTLDAGIPSKNISDTPPTFINQITFVWGASTTHVKAWRESSPSTKLSYYMPYSRAPAASLGFTLSFFLKNHPDWILYRCDRKNVAFWDGQSGDTGSVPLDFTNPDVIEWQIRNQSVHAANLNYDMMAFDNYGGGARAGANPGQACGVFDSNGNWEYRFGQNSLIFNDTLSRPEMIEYSLKWIELAHALMRNITPSLGIVPNICIDNNGWLDTDDAKRVMKSVTGVLSERGFSGWGSQRVEEAELLDEFRWMKELSMSNKTYFSINEIKPENFHEEWLEFSLSAFYIGYVPGASIWIGGVQAYGSWSYQSQLSVDLGSPEGEYYRIHEVLRRNFSHGIVILNPTQQNSTTITLDSNYIALWNNQSYCSGTEIALSPQSGKILLFSDGL